MEEFAEELNIIVEEFAEELNIIVEEFAEELNIFVEEFAVSLQQPAEISKVVSHMRDRARDWKVHINGDFA